MENENNTQEKITLTQVKAMGFNDKLIRELLPEPELKINPRYKRAAPMKLWPLEDIEKAMKSEAFLKHMENREKRQASAKKAVRTKEEKLMSEITEAAHKIRVTVIPLDRLRTKTLEEKQGWYNCIALERGYYESQDAYCADDRTVERWMVNYIRHNLTSYDKDLEMLFGRVGKGNAYRYLNEVVYDKICEAYPDLKEACERQLNWKFYDRGNSADGNDV